MPSLPISINPISEKGQVLFRLEISFLRETRGSRKIEPLRETIELVLKKKVGYIKAVHAGLILKDWTDRTYVLFSTRDI